MSGEGLHSRGPVRREPARGQLPSSQERRRRGRLLRGGGWLGLDWTRLGTIVVGSQSEMGRRIAGRGKGLICLESLNEKWTKSAWAFRSSLIALRDSVIIIPPLFQIETLFKTKAPVFKFIVRFVFPGSPSP